LRGFCPRCPQWGKDFYLKFSALHDGFARDFITTPPRDLDALVHAYMECAYQLGHEAGCAEPAGVSTYHIPWTPPDCTDPSES
jgi:hypothetical protein